MRKSTAINGTTAAQKRFAYAYFNNKGNGTQAAIEAGYSKKTAEQQASRLLSKVKVQRIIAKLNEKLESKAVITKERVIEEYTKIGLFDIRTLYDQNNVLKSIAEFSDEAGAAIAGIEKIGNKVKVKLHGKISALDSIRDIMGWKAPAKIAQTNTDGADISRPKMTDDQFELLLAEARATAIK